MAEKICAKQKYERGVEVLRGKKSGEGGGNEICTPARFCYFSTSNKNNNNNNNMRTAIGA